jgi:hypothetical protein
VSGGGFNASCTKRYGERPWSMTDLWFGFTCGRRLVISFPTVELLWQWKSVLERLLRREEDLHVTIHELP